MYGMHGGHRMHGGRTEKTQRWIPDVLKTVLLILAPTLLIWSHIFYVYYSNVSTDVLHYPTFLFLV